MVFNISERTDNQTDRQTYGHADRNTPPPRENEVFIYVIYTDILMNATAVVDS